MYISTKRLVRVLAVFVVSLITSIAIKVLYQNYFGSMPEDVSIIYGLVNITFLALSFATIIDLSNRYKKYRRMRNIDIFGEPKKKRKREKGPFGNLSINLVT